MVVCLTGMPLGVQNKQGEIRVDDAQRVLSHYLWNHTKADIKLWLSGWQINIAASNKLLKLLEEPQKDGFILISENEEDLIQTIRSVARFYISTV
jgi:DNA polymerase-3 subunit delta'